MTIVMCSLTFSY